FGAVQCRFEHKPAADLPGRGERATAHVLDGDFESGNSKNAVEYRVAVSSPNIGPNVRITDRNRFSTRNLDADETSTSTANGSSTRGAWRAARRVRRLLQPGRDGRPTRACGPQPCYSADARASHPEPAGGRRRRRLPPRTVRARGARGGLRGGPQTSTLWYTRSLARRMPCCTFAQESRACG